MTKKIESGLLERIQEAVQPLVKEGDFYLESIEYECYYSGVDVVLASAEFTIKIHVLLKAPEVFTCIIYPAVPMKNENYMFDAVSFFPLFDMDIPIEKRMAGYGPEINFPHLKKTHKTYQKTLGVMLDKTRFIDDISCLCSGIKKDLHRIRDFLAPDKIDETYRLYAFKAWGHAEEASGNLKKAGLQKKQSLKGE